MPKSAFLERVDDSTAAGDYQTPDEIFGNTSVKHERDRRDKPKNKRA